MFKANNLYPETSSTSELARGLDQAWTSHSDGVARRSLSIAALLTLAGCAAMSLPEVDYRVRVINATDYDFDRLFVFLGEKWTFVEKNVIPKSGSDTPTRMHFSGMMKFQWSREGEPMKVMEIPANVLPRMTEATKSLNFFIHDKKIVITQTTYDAGHFIPMYLDGKWLGHQKETTRQIFEKSL